MPPSPVPNKRSINWKKAYFDHLLACEQAKARQIKQEALVGTKYLYRYRPLSGYGLDELINGRVYMAKPEQLNDPYECKLLLDQTGKFPLKLGSAWSALHHCEIETRIASFCETPKRLTMWAHYANRPKGCCLEYKTADLLKHEPIIRGLHPVVYEPSLFDANSALNGPPENLGPILLRSACHKLTSWRYEREWRLIDLRLKSPGESAWPGIPLQTWAPNFDIDQQSQTIGFEDRGNTFVELPVPSRIILLGGQLDPDSERLIRGIGRLREVPIALAKLIPDAISGAELEILNEP